MIDFVKNPGQDQASSAQKLGELLKSQLEQDERFYFFSPDETTSNKLDAVFKASQRAWDFPIEPQDLPESQQGRIVELLSENVLFAALVGHTLAGKRGVLASYESFLNIITSQVIQHLKYLDQAAAIKWQTPKPALNLLSTSTCWRQDHNGFSHQSPALISTLLSIPSKHANCLFPVDATAAEVAFNHALAPINQASPSLNNNTADDDVNCNNMNHDIVNLNYDVINLITLDKNEEPLWIDSHHAEFQFDNGGASIFGFASDDLGDLTEKTWQDFATPTFIFTAAGDIATREALYAMQILRRDLPGIQLRFVGLAALSYHQIGTANNSLKQSIFNEYFGPDATALPIIANFHGFPDTLKIILAQYAHPARLSVHGFEERGTTTTPFEMLAMNHASRYDLALDVVRRLHRPDLIEKYQRILRVNHEYATQHGIDLPPITDFHF